MTIKVSTPIECRWLIAKEKPLAMPVLPKCGSTALKTHNSAFFPHVSAKEVLDIPERVAWLRQPINRLYSCWCNFHRGDKEVGTGKQLSNWEEFIDLILNGESNVHWNPQILQLSYNGIYLPTITERFENLSVNFNNYLPGVTLAYKNTSTSRPAYTFYRRTELEEYYKADLDMWESI